MNIDEIIALRKAFTSVKQRQRKNIPRDFDEKVHRLKAARALSVGNPDLISQTVGRLEKNGIQVFSADTAAEALTLILREIGDETFVVKSKSNVTKEISLTSVLESREIQCIETDVGDRILQIMKGRPSHPTGPASHLSAKAIAHELARFYGHVISEDPNEIVRVVRDDIKSAVKKARIGITGANAITAEEGAIVLAHNEGNIFEVMRKEKHIVVTSIDKVYPSVEDALNMLKVISFNATGSLIPSFIEIISGVSKTADVEKKFFRGVHSPEEIILILLDNHRTEIINKGFRELLFCIDCGNCLLHCPMYNTVGTDFADDKHLGGKGLVYKSVAEEEVHKKLAFCLTCGRCKKNCPLSIDIPAAIRTIRSENLPQEAYYFFKSHLLWLYYNLIIALR
jgi:L-lactate utilization protein LutB